MSQSKVDKYKQEKASRQQTIKKEKRMHKIKVAVGSLVVLVLAGWVGFSVFDKVAIPFQHFKCLAHGRCLGNNY